MNGFHVDLGATMLMSDWFARAGHGSVPPLHLRAVRPDGSTFTYRGATDMYYGLIAGIAVMTEVTLTLRGRDRGR